MTYHLASRFLALHTDTFDSQEEFDEFRSQHEIVLATRWLHERSFSSTKKELAFKGTCGVCLRPATFDAITRGGEPAGPGRVPNWRETMSCDCRSRLISRERGVLQFIIGNLGLQPWTRVLLIGSDSRFAEALETLVAGVTRQSPRNTRPADTDTSGAASPQYHLAVALETLHVAVSPIAMLRDAAQALLPGGRFVFTFPFHSGEPHSTFVDARSGADHRIGWDILQHAKDAGFRSAVAHLYWSEEFGYMGSPNLIFYAAR